MVRAGVETAYKTLDLIDSKLVESGLTPLSQLVELANLSTIIGNLIAQGIVNASGKTFSRAGPHKYQDLRAAEECNHVEIKVALEKNAPKAHLAKEGFYLTFRYILGDAKASAFNGTRGEIVWIWEIRFGKLEKEHFNVSNTAGDSGKTAVVNSKGMDRLSVLYADLDLMPSSRRKINSPL